MSSRKAAKNVEKYRVKSELKEITFLFLLNAAYFFPVLLNSKTRVISAPGTDTWSQYFYWRQFGFGSLARGDIPLWNPYIFSGTPFVAGIQSALFYPLNVVYLFFDTPFAINLSVAIHCFLAGLFTYIFARYIDMARSGALLAAITFAFGAPYFFHIYPGHLSNLCTMIWLPLLMMGVEALIRTKDLRCAVWSGLALAAQFLAGHPQYFFYSTIAVSLYFVIRITTGGERSALRSYLAGYAIFLAIGVLVSMIQLLPTIELVKYSVRQGLTYDWVFAFSLPPSALLTLLLPNFFGDMVHVPYWGKNYLWEMSSYLGIVPLAMCLIAISLERSKQVLIFCSIAAVSLLLALGKYTPLSIVLYNYVPGFDRFRGISKFLFVFSLASSIVAGYGLQKLTALAEEKRVQVRSLAYVILAGAFVLIVLAVTVWMLGQDIWPTMVISTLMGADRYSPPPALTESFMNAAVTVALSDIVKASLILFLLGGSLFLFSVFKRIKLESLILFLLALTALDLAQFGSRYLVTFDPREVSMDREIEAFMKQDQAPFRFASPSFGFLNQGQIAGIENAGGYDAIVLKRYSEFINASQRLPIDEPNLVIRPGTISPALSLLNVKYLVVENGAALADPTVELVFQGRNYKAYRNNNVLPRSFVVHDVRVLRERDTLLQTIARGESLGSFAIVEEPVGLIPARAIGQSPAPKIIEHSLNRVTLQADLKEQGFLVLADSYFPGWKGFVDGQETKIYRTNYVMRGLVVPAGPHRVEFRYDPLSFKIGAIVTCLSFLVVTGFLIGGRFARRIQPGFRS